MKNEAEFKAAFKKSVRAQGGFAISLAAPMMNGIPDLYVIMPGYCPILLEAKWLGNVPNNFLRKIPYTKMQRMYIEECCKIKDYTAMGLIGWKRNGFYECILSHHTVTHASLFAGDSISVAEKKIFDVNKLFYYHPIPRINGIHATTST